MRTIALLLATVQASKLASKTSTKNEAEYWSTAYNFGTEYNNIMAGLQQQMQELQNSGLIDD